MSDGKSNPPKGAIWILKHLCPGDNEALTGDLIERFREGQRRGWFWKQVFIAFAIGILGEMRSHLPHFCYALAGTVMPVFLWQSVRGSWFWFRWWTLPWPWSQLVFELNGTAVLALAALPVLAIALEINGAFRWLSLFWTAAITFTLLAFGHYLLDVFDLIVSPELQVLLVFSTFLAAAWIGCVKPRQDAMARSALN